MVRIPNVCPPAAGAPYAIESCVQVDCEYQRLVWALVDGLVTAMADPYAREFKHHPGARPGT